MYTCWFTPGWLIIILYMFTARHKYGWLVTVAMSIILDGMVAVHDGKCKPLNIIDYR